MTRLGADRRACAALRGRFARVLALVALLVAAAGVVVSTAPSAAADGPTTITNSTSIAIPATGSPNQTGPASPYPSNITVSGMAGSVSVVKVAFNDLNQSVVNDIDAMVVAPSGENLVVLSDVGDPSSLAFANHATLTFDDAAAGLVPSGNIPTGTYKPTNTNGVDTFPAPAPAPSTQTTLAGAFTGINPNGVWKLYVVDDNSGDIGTMDGGWSLTVTTEVAAVATSTVVTTSGTPSTTGDSVTFTARVTSAGTPVAAGSVQFSDGATNLGAPVALNGSGVASRSTTSLSEGTHEIRASYSGATGFLASNGSVTQRVDNATVVTGNTFCNPGPLTVPVLGSAQPYPSNITVSGLTGSVSKVTATLKGLSHAVPVDLDVLLAGPQPTTNVVLLSDSGGNSAVGPLNVTFDDDATGGVPSSLVSGTFKPTDDDINGADSFPAPAPAPGTATALSTFNGSAPNGVWSLWVNDDASGDGGSIADGWCLTVTTPSPTTTTAASSLNPSTFGTSVTLTATVLSAGAPVTTGSVQFSDGGSALGGPVTLASDGTATFTTSTLAVGTHLIGATYTGTAAFTQSSGSVSQVVNKLVTTTTLTSDTNPSSAGQAVTFTATVVSSGSPVATGSVQFSDGGSALGGLVTLASDGTATFTTSTLAVGTHPILATYSGTANFGASSGSVNQLVNQLVTTTTLTSDTNPSSAGQAVTFTATVVSSGSPVATGSVQFSDGGSALGGLVTLASDGTATFTTSTLAVGTHPILATYSGTANFGASSGSVNQLVNQLVTTTTLTSDTNPSSAGQAVTFTATVVSGGSPITTGSVQFSVDGSVVATGVVLDAAGQATFPTSTLTTGTHTVLAQYSGTADFEASSTSLDQVVNKVVTTTTLTSDSNPSSAGQAVSFTATVASGGSPATTGSVHFSDGGSALGGQVTLASDGTATFTTSTLAVGTHTILATYSGTADFEASEDTLDQVVNLVADAGGPYVVAEGETLTLDGSGSTSGATYEWDVNGDGDFSDATGLTPTLTWAQLEALGINDGPSSDAVALRVSLASSTVTDTAILDVTNTAPASVVIGNLVATVGEPFTVKVGADDPSTADLAAGFHYTVDWGDGSPVETMDGPADPPVTHTYAAAGSVSASFSATDKDGGRGEPTAVQVQVDPAVTPTPTPTPSLSPQPTSSIQPTTSALTSVSTQEEESLASTGAAVGSVALTGGALVVSGVGVLLAERRRRRVTRDR